MATSEGELRRELAELTLSLCRIPSETGNEREIGDWIENRCRAIPGDLRIERIGHSIVCGPPIAWAEGDPRPLIALVGHTDTVRCAEEQPTEIRDERVYGCGASDMKAGVAVMLSLLERWEQLVRARPIWIFYDGEEGPAEGNGLEPVMQSGVVPPLGLAVVLEPTDQALQMGCMGTLHATVTVRGQRAHSARPWQGENALFRAIPLLERLSALERREVRIGELSFFEVVVPTQLRTVNSPNVVPDSVMINVNVRFAPGRAMEDAERDLRELVGGDGEVELTDNAPSGTVYLDHPLIEELRGREDLPVRPKQAWTDVARFTERGIPAVNFGPGETAQAHQAGEWCSIDSLEHCYRALGSFLRG